ncbi:hypothetical protein OIV83_003662 [Microbotryomycetes sp. JL201]|nr:hypothetical protein OIV83_003662 [Microbotryomycetes sp. JL201]
MPHPTILSLAPDSLASLGELDNDSLSELWAVFTKCKDNLHNGRRLENLSWRLWFDSSRRESSLDDPLPPPSCANAALSDPEDGNDTDWTESSATDVDEDAWDSDSDARRASGSPPSPSLVAAQPPPAVAAPAPRSPTRPAAAALHDAATQRPHNRRRSSAQQSHAEPTATRPPMLRPEWRSSSTISGGSIQRIISAQPPISVPFKSHSVVEVTPIPLISPNAAGVTSRHSSAPDQLEPAPIAQALAAAVDPTRSPRKLVDARTQTTPSSSHRPSPKLPTTSALASPPLCESDSTQAMSAPSIKLVKSPASYTAQKGHARKSSAPKPPPPTPATSVRDANARVPTLQSSSSSNSNRPHLTPQSSVKGFDTTVFENRPLQGSIAPPPTPATALAQLAPSPPKRAPSALKGAPTSNGATRTPANGRTSNGAGGGTAKKIFFISSPTSDSEDDGTSSCRSTRSRVSDWQSAVQVQGKRSSLSESVKAEDLRKERASGKRKDDGDDDEWDEDEDDVSSEWSSEVSENEDRAQPVSTDRSEQTVFAKRPSSAALSGQAGELKRRPPGLLSQLFHPDLFLDDADRRHSLIDVRRANGAPPSESLSGLSTTQSEANSPARSRLQTSKSTSVLGDSAMRHTSRSRSFLKGRPDDIELESSSDESDYEDVESSQDAEMLRRQQQQAHLAERLRLEQLTSQPIAPPQTPRSTRRAMLATELSESLRRNLLWERQQRNRVLGGPVNKFKLAQHPPSAAAAAVGAVAGHQTLSNGVSRQSTAPSAPEQATVQQHKASTTTKVDSTSALGTSVQNDAGGEMVRRHTTGAGLYLEGLAGESTREGGKIASRRQQESQPATRRRGGSDGHHPSAFAFKGLTSMTQAMVSPPRPVFGNVNNGRGTSGDDSDDESDTSDDDNDEVDDKGKRDQPLTRRKSTFSSIWGQKVW